MQKSDHAHRSQSDRATIHLALGSNLGDRQANLRTALEQLGPQVAIDACSSVYETAPAYVTNQPSFFNMVVRGSTMLPPHDLLRLLKQIEQQMGRVTTLRYGPRVIDLDILLYSNLQLADADLVIPHPRIVERAFVLVPMAEISPHLLMPGQRDTVATLARRTTQHGEVLRVIS